MAAEKVTSLPQPFGNEIMHYMSDLLFDREDNTIYALLTQARSIHKKDKKDLIRGEVYSAKAVGIPGEFPILDLELWRGVGDPDEWAVRIELRKDAKRKEDAESLVSIGGYVRESSGQESKQSPKISIYYKGKVLRPFETNDSDELQVSLVTSLKKSKEVVLNPGHNRFSLINVVNEGNTVSYPEAIVTLDQLADGERQGMIEAMQDADKVKIYDIECAGGLFAFKYSGFPSEGNFGAIKIPTNLHTVRVR